MPDNFTYMYDPMPPSAEVDVGSWVPDGDLHHIVVVTVFEYIIDGLEGD